MASAFQERKWQKQSGRVAIEKLEWSEKRNGAVIAEVQTDGFLVRVVCKPDYDYDFSENRGKFTSKWEAGAVKNPRARYDNNLCEYFVPDTTVAEHRHELIKMGYSKSVAQEMAESYVKEDLKIAADAADAGYIAYSCMATAYLLFDDDIELGEGSCFGIEMKYGEYEYLDEVAHDCIAEAVSEAKAKVEKLREHLNA